MGVCVVSVCVARSIAQEVDGSQPGGSDAVLERIASAYEGVRGTTVELGSPEHPSWSVKVTVASDGRYQAVDHEDSGERNEEYIYSAVDDTYAYQTGMAGIEKNSLEKFPRLRIWWAYHFDAPWPMVTSWVHALRRAEDVMITQSSNLLTIESADEQLSLTFDVGTLALIRVGQVGGVDYFFEGFDVHDPPMPTSVRVVSDLPARGTTPAQHFDDRRVYTTLELNPPDLAARVRFDPAELGLNLYDPKSGIVSDPTGKKLYSHKDYAKRMLAEAHRQAAGKPERVDWSLGRWIMVGGVILLVMTGGVVVWQRRGKQTR